MEDMLGESSSMISNIANNCSPGRFFVSHELKMLFAYLILNYDIKHIDDRPKAFWFGRSCVPPAKASIVVRRIKVA